MEPEITGIDGLSVLEIIIIFVLGGGLAALLSLLWRVSKRDSKLDNLEDSLGDAFVRIDKLEHTSVKGDSSIIDKLDVADRRILELEKELIEIKSNQKNLLHSIDVQNYQVLDLIERIEKNHQSFVDTQTKINDKLESAINAIKDSLISLAK